MSYNDPYAHQQPNQQPYDPYASVSYQYNNSYPPTEAYPPAETYPPPDNPNPPWNEASRASSSNNKQYDANYAPERLSRMGTGEPPKLVLCSASSAAADRRAPGIQGNSDYGGTQSTDTSGQKYVEVSGSLSLPSSC